MVFLHDINVKLLLEKGNKLVCMDEQCGYVKNKPTEEK